MSLELTRYGLPPLPDQWGKLSGDALLMLNGSTILADDLQPPIALRTLPLMIFEGVSARGINIKQGLQAWLPRVESGGYVVWADVVAPNHKKQAAYVNAIERFANPLVAPVCPFWKRRKLMDEMGLVEVSERMIQQPTTLRKWAVRGDEGTLQRLLVMLIQAPEPMRQWYGLDPLPARSYWHFDLPFTVPWWVTVMQKP